MGKYCLIGKSLRHSLSAEIHALFGLDYSLVELADETALCNFVKSGEFDGFNVTIPYKEQIVKYLDFVSDDAKAIGAVNTVVKTKRGLCGYNTDYEGLRFALKNAGISVGGKTVAVLGSGGASKTAQSLLANCGAKNVIVVSRAGAVDYQNVYEKTDVEIVINATPVGTFPDNYSSPVELCRFPRLKGVFDLTYNPLTTRLVAEARRLGIAAANGLYMLVEQARLARDLFVGENSSQDLTTSVVKRIRRKMSNLVLVGMPASGKSTIGKAAARLLDKEFVDLDEEIKKRDGRTPEEIIRSDGEKVFRAIEKSVALETAKGLGRIIATGGGVVTDGENVNALKQNGVVAYVTRPLELLSVEGRPLSASKGVRNLFENRKNLYGECADFTVDNSSSVNNAIKETVSKYEKLFSD